jgi:hypothetical protein
MIKLKNSAKLLLNLNFTGYIIHHDNREEVLLWLEKSLDKSDYYGKEGNTIFLRNPAAEIMLKLKFNDYIVETLTR